MNSFRFTALATARSDGVTPLAAAADEDPALASSITSTIAATHWARISDRSCLRGHRHEWRSGFGAHLTIVGTPSSRAQLLPSKRTTRPSFVRLENAIDALHGILELVRRTSGCPSNGDGVSF